MISIRAASALLVLPLLLVASQAASAYGLTVNIPSSDQTATQRVPSPDGRFSLVGTTVRTNLPTDKCPACFSLETSLWIEDNLSHARKLLLKPGSSAQAGWSPDGNNFFVNDREASDQEFAYLYRTADLKRIDLDEMILAADPAAKRFLDGHFYFAVDRWLGKNSMVVSLDGHTDIAPEKCFLLRYRVSRLGAVQKLSESQRPVDRTFCEWINSGAPKATR